MGACRHFGNIQFQNSNISIRVIVYTVSSVADCARRASWLTVALTRVRRIESATFRATVLFGVFREVVVSSPMFRSILAMCSHTSVNFVIIILFFFNYLQNFNSKKSMHDELVQVCINK